MSRPTLRARKKRYRGARRLLRALAPCLDITALIGTWVVIVTLKDATTGFRGRAPGK